MAASVVLFISLWLGQCRALFIAEATLSCVDKCHHPYNRTLPCQCNDQCDSHGNCCHDYATLCTAAGSFTSGPGCSSSLHDVTEELWRSDVNRLDPSLYTINLQAKVSSNNTDDHAPAPLFSHVDSGALSSRPTFQAFLALQNNYNPADGQHDVMSSQSSAEVDHFLDLVLRTAVMTHLYDYLKCRGVVVDQNDFRTQLHQLWFSPYPRHSGGTLDTSGFEHVMVGEYKGTSVVNGLHNWLAYYSKERTHAINYLGYIGQLSPNLVAVNYMWNGHHKNLGAFFVGTSPEFDLALFTLCALTHSTAVSLAGHSVHVTTFTYHSPGGIQIATAYPTF